MHTRIDQKFEALAAEGKKGFIPYITAGDPSLEATEDIVLRLEDIGADMIELGVPFSDPLADGEANQRAAERALESGTTLSGILQMVTRLRERTEIPLIFFSYMNPLYAHGFEKTVKRAAKAGIDGFLMVDLAIEEATPFKSVLDQNEMNNICMVTPTTPNDRIERIAEFATGFVYVVSREGVTGAQKNLQDRALGLLKRTHKHTSLPVALGFGVSTPAQARAYAEITEAVVVGSHIVTTYFKAGDSAKGRAAATREISKLAKAIKEI